MTATTARKEHPILFSSEMIRALLAGRKTRTRRLDESWMKVKAGDRLWVRENWRTGKRLDASSGKQIQDICESAGFRAKGNYPCCPMWYEADGAFRQWGSDDISDFGEKGRLRIGRFMCRWGSRITLEATADARKERLQEITEEEAIAEGCVSVAFEHWYEGMKPMLDGTRVRQESRGLPPATWTEVRLLSEVNGGSDYDPCATTARESFRRLWSSLHTDPGERWADNPEVVVLSFKVLEAKHAPER